MLFVASNIVSGKYTFRRLDSAGGFSKRLPPVVSSDERGCFPGIDNVSEQVQPEKSAPEVVNFPTLRGYGLFDLAQDRSSE